MFRLSTPPNNDASAKDLERAFQILASGQSSSSLEERQAAFQTLRNSCSPVTNRTPAYALELERVFALRFSVWNEVTSFDMNESQKTLLANKIRGLVFGAALGDAVGLSTEFMTQAEIEERYDKNHVFSPGSTVHPDIHRLNFPHGDWTDDTDQLLLVLQTLLECQGRYYGPMFARKLLDWKENGFPGLGDSSGAGLGQSTKAVLQHGDFATDPQVAARDVWVRGGQKMAANGAVMRTAITAVPYFWSRDQVKQTTRDFCLTTHADPRCIASCLVIAECLRSLLEGSTQPLYSVPSLDMVNQLVEEAVAFALLSVKDELSQEATLELWYYARIESLADLKLDDATSIGYTFKCRGTGLYSLREAASRIPSASQKMAVVVEEIIQDIVRQGGDSDTNATVAGALLGALVGMQGLPSSWINELPYGGWLEAWIPKLLFMMRLPISSSQ